jgi:hypothetical protein
MYVTASSGVPFRPIINGILGRKPNRAKAMNVIMPLMMGLVSSTTNPSYSIIIIFTKAL